MKKDNDKRTEHNKRKSNRKASTSKRKINKKNIEKKPFDVSIDKDKFLSKLIDPTIGGTNKVPFERLKSAVKDDTIDLVLNGTDYHLTPKGILWAAMDSYYNIGSDMNKFNKFAEEMLKHLSMLASGNESTDMFGNDFNDFFEVFVSALNMSGKMKQILDEHNIPFDVKEYLGNVEFEKQDDDTNANNEDKNGDSDDSSSERHNKPKKRK